MDEHIKRVFVREIQTQARFALAAMDGIRLALSEKNTSKLFFSVQAFLGASGNISKLLWPNNAKIPNRGEELRQILAVPDDSPLQPRRFRNHFEHFDERLEDWALSPGRRNLVDMSVFPSGAIQGIDQQDYMRNLDPTTLTLTFRGETYNLAEVEGAVTQVNAATKEVLDLSS